MIKTYLELLMDLKQSATWMMRSPNTKRTYECMASIAKRHKMDCGFNLDDFESIFKTINQSSMPTGVKVNFYRVLKSLYYSYCQRNGIQISQSLQRCRGLSFNHVVRVQKPLTKTEEAMIWDECMDNDDEFVRIMAACCRLMMYTGLRPSELLNLKWEHVSDTYITVFGGKRRFATELNRKLVITTEARMALSYFMTLKGVNVVWNNGAEVRYATLSRWWHKIFVLSGLEPKNIYACRHGLGTAMWNKGYDISVIQGQLGHRDLKTTMRYVNPTKEEIADRFKGI